MRLLFLHSVNCSLDFSHSWPPGKYCIYKRGPTCPDGLSEGFVIWDDENTDNQNDKGGVLPEGQYTEDTKIYFCCSTHGFADKDIPLPSKKPFFLFAYESLKCQKVSKESFRFFLEVTPRNALQVNLQGYYLYYLRNILLNSIFDLKNSHTSVRILRD